MLSRITVRTAPCEFSNHQRASWPSLARDSETLVSIPAKANLAADLLWPVGLVVNHLLLFPYLQPRLAGPCLCNAFCSEVVDTH